MFLAEKVMQVLFLRPNHFLPQRELVRTSKTAVLFILVGLIKCSCLGTHFGEIIFDSSK